MYDTDRTLETSNFAGDKGKVPAILVDLHV